MEDTNAGPTPDWDARATAAAQSVLGLYGKPLFFLPGTHLAATAYPTTHLRNLTHHWHYWWQAHYLDCLVDAGSRGMDDATKVASRLLTSIRLRNYLRYVNSFYDDMAWLALAALRLERLTKSESPRFDHLRRTLTGQFDSASTDELGGGTFWSRKRDFKNTPATSPVALYYARTGQTAKAQALVDWLNAKLYYPGTGLYLDGLRIHPGGEVKLEDAVYTYNQGPVLGALLELGGEANVKRAEELIEAVDLHLHASSNLSSVLRTDGTGDGGLFTGILVRYLALAARDDRLPQRTRGLAAALVTDTASALWDGRRSAVFDYDPSAEPSGHLIFSRDAEQTAAVTYPEGTPVDLSTQLQAWMIFEAAATLNGLSL